MRYNIQFHILVLVLHALFSTIFFGLQLLITDASADPVHLHSRSYNGLLSYGHHNKFPFMLSIERLVNRTHRYICGGVLVHERYVLTRNTCLEGIDEGRTEDTDMGDHEFPYGELMAVSSLEANTGKQMSIQRKHRVILAMRLITHWLTFPDCEKDLTNGAVKNDIAIVMVEFDFPNITFIQPKIIEKDDTHQMSTQYFNCKLIHWPTNIINMNVTTQDHSSLTESTVSIVDWKLCNTSSFIDEWNHICGQFGLNAASPMTSSGGPLICNGLIKGFMSNNIYVFEDGRKRVVYAVFMKVENFRPFILGIVPETEVLMPPIPIKTKSTFSKGHHHTTVPYILSSIFLWIY